jgi:hypothetical protein
VCRLDVGAQIFRCRDADPGGVGRRLLREWERFRRC